MARRVSAYRRHLARKQAAETSRFADTARRRALRLFSAARTLALADLARGRNPLGRLDGLWDEIIDLMRQSMLAARLTGARTSIRKAPLPLAAANDDPLSRAIAYLARLLGLSTRQLRELERDFETDIFRVVQETRRSTERRLREAVTESIARGDHVREGARRLAAAFEAAGIVPENSYTIENVFRTQTLTAYAAGKAEIEQDPAVQEILWGYTYVTVGDSRVRPAHAALDGVTLPKDDPFWLTNYPPNGFSCRCQAIALFTAEKIVRPPEGATADPGFRWRPDQLFGAIPLGQRGQRGRELVPA